jgi:20S proteasome subunit beta 4
MASVPFAAHGYGSYFALSTLDRCVGFSRDWPSVICLSFRLCRYHDPSASLEQGLATLKKCIDEVQKRLIVSLGNFKVKIVDKDGAREIEL